MKFMKNKKQEIKPEPRQLEEITKEYNIIAARLGAVHYQGLVMQREAEELIKKMSSLNSEGADRNKLDAEAKAKEASNEAK